MEERNESGFIEGEAIQLGEWINSELHFQKFGWVPPVNTPIFFADTTNIQIPRFRHPKVQLGKIPNTTLPSIMDLNLAISHHLAILGITGSGKSFIAKEIIQGLKSTTKVIIVDFTSEWKKKFSASDNITLNLDQNTISRFLNSDNQIGIVELPSLSNTVDVLESTEKVLEKIFNFAKTRYDEENPTKICLVLEEAHTITPESSFLSDLGQFGSAKAIVNKMGQVALQGRKYGVGLIVIAQRTANVSKTVLTQCNSIICFQAFDETSFNFLGNYVGKEFVQALPNLKQYHAIVTGKAFKSSLPMIVDLSK
ncbi:ATP-binding protein [Leptonema illini]|uniref:ATP-binding protein n=1 Tax=Leptonema illini TaxID=183 RepID=UPI0012F4EE14|nr:DUF87 domain-containing protein [Leptonema illini]